MANSVWALADLATPMAVRVAATLRLADHIDAGTGDPAALAEVVDADPDALARLLQHLAVAGVVAPDGDGGYALTGAGRQLLDEHPGGARAWLDLEGATGRADLAFMGLLDSVRTGGAAYPGVFGAGFWEDLDADPDLSASFDALMGEHPAVEDALNGYDWSTTSTVADIGGGDGTLLAALLAARPHLHGVLVERPDPARAAMERFAAAGVADRAEVVPGSFFEPLPAGLDVYLLSRVVNDWDDERATAILRRCADAARARAGGAGRVLVLEEGPADADSGASTEMDLRMLVYCAGRDRSLSDMAAIARAAGLTVARDIDGVGSTLLELRPARRRARS